ncbi:hypothetical protein PENTCL1PPCAC_19256, partial [Pristionchus entomophagus]
MAAVVARNSISVFGIQLLLSVQNVAVDNKGAAMQKMGLDGEEVYNMKSTKKLDLWSPASFDFLDQMDEATLKGWRDGTVSLKRNVKIHDDRDKNRDREERRWRRDDRPEYEEKELSYEDELTFDRRKFEGEIAPKIILWTVEMVLKKMYGHGNLCAKLELVK